MVGAHSFLYPKVSATSNGYMISINLFDLLTKQSNYENNEEFLVLANHHDGCSNEFVNRVVLERRGCS